MQLSREYISYLAREVTHRLADSKLIAVPDLPAATALVHQAMAEELSVEERINAEARSILDAHEADMQRLGASYADAFKKIKAELVRQRKVVL